MLSTALLIAVWICLVISIMFGAYGVASVMVANLALKVDSPMVEKLAERANISEDELLEALPKIRAKGIFDICFFGLSTVLLLLSIFFAF